MAHDVSFPTHPTHRGGQRSPIFSLAHSATVGKLQFNRSRSPHSQFCPVILGHSYHFFAMFQARLLLICAQIHMNPDVWAQNFLTFKGFSDTSLHISSFKVVRDLYSHSAGPGGCKNRVSDGTVGAQEGESKSQTEVYPCKPTAGLFNLGHKSHEFSFWAPNFGQLSRLLVPVSCILPIFWATVCTFSNVSPLVLS